MNRSDLVDDDGDRRDHGSHIRCDHNMMLDMLVAIARKDYTTRRQRAAQGVQKARAEGKYRGRAEDPERNALIQKHLKAGLSSWNKIMALVGCGRGTIAKQVALLKAVSNA